VYLCKLGKVFFFVKIGLGQEFDSIFAAILCPGGHICGVIKLEATARIDIIVLGRRGAGKDLTN
jgi:hypothetical protein